MYKIYPYISYVLYRCPNFLNFIAAALTLIV